LVIGPDGERLAKRHGAITLRERTAAGETSTQTLSLLAASAGLADPGETVTTRQLVSRFDPDRLPRSPWRI
jgi:glutamyl-tRNA synthetase